MPLSHADRNADISFVYYFVPMSVFLFLCPSFLRCHHPHVSIILSPLAPPNLESFDMNQINISLPSPLSSFSFPSFLVLSQLFSKLPLPSITTHSLCSQSLNVPPLFSSRPCPPCFLVLSSDLRGCSCLSSHPNLTTSAL